MAGQNEGNTVSMDEIQQHIDPATMDLLRGIQRAAEATAARLRDEEGKLSWAGQQAVARLEEGCFWIEKHALTMAAKRLNAAKMAASSANAEKN